MVQCSWTLDFNACHFIVSIFHVEVASQFDTKRCACRCLRKAPKPYLEIQRGLRPELSQHKIWQFPQHNFAGRVSWWVLVVF
jgi:hypothetical protein